MVNFMSICNDPALLRLTENLLKFNDGDSTRSDDVAQNFSCADAVE